MEYFGVSIQGRKDGHRHQTTSTRGLVIVWHRLAPFIEDLRVKRNQPGHTKQFQMLAIEAKKHRDDFRQKDDHRAVVAAEDK